MLPNDLNYVTVDTDRCSASKLVHDIS